MSEKKECQHRWEETPNKERITYHCAKCGGWRFV